MPTFDFDTPIDRNNMGCAKWDRRTDAEKAANVVPMSIADMEFRGPPCVTEVMERAARHGAFGYTDPDGAYYDAVAGWMRGRHGWETRHAWIVPQNGVVPAMCVAVRAFTEPGERVIIQSPGYYPFREAVLANGREPVFNPLTRGEDDVYHMDLDGLRRQAADPRAKMMFLCSPHNPVGRIWTREELGAVADICGEHHVLVVSDEIHFDLELYGKHIVFAQAAPQMADQCVILTAPGKSFNLAGLQISNAIIPNETLRARLRERVHADGYSNIAYFGYHATLAAYTKGEPWLDAMLAYVRQNFSFLKNWLQDNLPAIRLLPVQGTYLAWTDWRGLGMADAELARFARGEAMLILGQGKAFGQEGEGFMRLNLALPRAELERALERLGKAAKARGFREGTPGRGFAPYPA
ncbi:MAG: pyridoxal phosphate-dependent aminotransferase [Firmicutes bacterium]|nr:pyridoxal phosphate-dependent aminotransferase [Bacillota bacterium]